MICPRSPGSKEGAGLECRAGIPVSGTAPTLSLSLSTSLSPFSLVPAPSCPQPLLTTSALCHSYEDMHRTTNHRHLSRHRAVWCLGLRGWFLLMWQRLSEARSAVMGSIQELHQDDQERAVARARTRAGLRPLRTGPGHSFQPRCTGQHGPCPMRMRTGFSDFRPGSLGPEHF